MQAKGKIARDYHAEANYILSNYLEPQPYTSNLNSTQPTTNE